MQSALNKKWSFLLRISSVNVTKSAGICRVLFNGKLHLLCRAIIHFWLSFIIRRLFLLHTKAFKIMIKKKQSLTSRVPSAIVWKKLVLSNKELFSKKGVLKNFAKFTGKYLRQILFFNKVAGLRLQACNFIKKETLAQVFSCEFCEIFNKTFSQNTSGWLLL